MHRGIAIIIAAIAIVAVALPGPASAELLPQEAAPKASPAEVAAVARYVTSPSFIVSRSEFRHIDSDPVPELIAISKDRRSKSYVRERALKSLSLYRDSRVKAHFRDLLSGKRPDRYFAVTVMADLEAFGEEAVPHVASYLDHKDPGVRGVVIKALGLFGGQAGYDLLTERSRTESDPVVIAALRRFID